MTEKKTILLTDDTQSDHDFFSKAIKDLGVTDYTVVHAFDGLEAMDYLLKRGDYESAPAVLPEFIVLDLHMPLKDGISTLKDIKSILALQNIPVYMLTSSWTASDLKTCYETGCAGYFIKPDTAGDLKTFIMMMINKLK